MLRLDITPQRAPDNSPYEALVVPALRSVDINIDAGVRLSLKAVFPNVVKADPEHLYQPRELSHDVTLEGFNLPDRGIFFNAVAADEAANGIVVVNRNPSAIRA